MKKSMIVSTDENLKTVDMSARTKLLFHLKDHGYEYAGLPRRDTAIKCSESLGFAYRETHINDARAKLVAIGVTVWVESKTFSHNNFDLKKRVELLEKQIEEQDKKFAIVFQKLHAIQTHSAKEQMDKDGFVFSTDAGFSTNEYI